MQKLKSFGFSDIGTSRLKNEDVFLSLPEYGFFALADGMGGHRAGEVAAKTTIETLTKYVKKLKTEDLLEKMIELRYAIEKANHAVFQLGKTSSDLLGMGTTLCCLFGTEKAVIYAHIGDSRVYRYRDQKLELLTEDHSLFAKWLATGKLAEECKTPYPYKNVITRAIGTKKTVTPEIAFSEKKPGDLFFLSSDGLTDVLSLAEMEKILEFSPNLEMAAFGLIEQAKFKGSSDNMTVLIIQEDDETDLSRQQCNHSFGQKSS